MSVNYERPEFSPAPKPAPKLLAKQKAESKADREWWRLRRAVLARDGHQCRACRSSHGLEAHHVVFRSLGGKDEIGNLVALCRDCHAALHGHVLKFVIRHRHEPQKALRFEWVK